MRVVQILGIAVFALVIAAGGGYYAYRTIKDGEPPIESSGAATTTKRGAHPLTLPLRCLQRVEQRTHDSRARYASWASLESGPTCQEPHAEHGVGELYDDAPELCRAAAEHARSTGATSLAGALDRLHGDLTTLHPLVAEAATYYDTRAFEKDDCARGKTLHDELVVAWASTLSSINTARDRADQLAEESNRIVRDRVRREFGVNSPQIRILELVTELDHLAALFADGTVEPTELDELDTFAGRIARLNVRLDSDQKTLEKQAKKNKKNKKTGGKGAPLSKPEVKLVRNTDKLVKLTRKLEIRRNNGNAPTIHELNAVERELRKALDSVRNLGTHPPVISRYGKP